MATVIAPSTRSASRAFAFQAHHEAVSVYHSIDDVDPAEWNSLARPAGDPFMAIGLIRAVEESMASCGRFEYVLFRNPHGTPVAAACLCSYRVDASLLAEGTARIWAERIAKFCPWLFRHNVVFCGLPFSAGQSHLRIAPNVDPRPILRELDALARDLARRTRAKCIVFKEFNDDETDRYAELPALGYHRADSPPMNVGQTGFDSFEAFVNSQKSKKRHPIRTSQKRFGNLELRVVQMRGGDGADQIYTDEVHRLYDNVLDRATVKLERLPAEYFRALARNYPENSAFTFIYQGDRVVAFAASVFAGNTFHQMFVGIDYDLNPQVDLYFNLFFFALDAGYQLKPEILHVGQSADTFKQNKLCCTPIRLSFFVSGTDRFGKWLIGKFFDTLFPPRWNVGTDSHAASSGE